MNSRSREAFVVFAVAGVAVALFLRHYDVLSMIGLASSDTDRINMPAFSERPGYQAVATVDLTRPGQSISDYIYGVCDLPEKSLRDFGIPITRWGGNATTRFNWKINADNGAADWYFKNRGAPIRDRADTAYLKNLRQARARGGTAYQTLPMIGWVAKDHQSYGFSVRKYGPQKASEPGHADVGDGRNRDGQLIRGNDPNDTSVAVGPEFMAEAAAFVARHDNGERFWALDNEPMLWQQTHRDVRPEPLGYDELWERTVYYAEAIKKADPSAKVAGFCSWGWTDLFYSARDEGSDRYATRPDHAAHGGMPLAEWFIRQCGEYKRKHGRALVDVFDFHWYPQAEWDGQTPYQARGMSAGLNELRLRSTREMWDPSYVAESWVRNAGDQRPPQVIRRLREWIDRHNPGMQLCLGEYNFGGADNITGGLAQAELFGIMAREKVDLAFIWTTPEGTQNLAWKLFRDYDGAGSRFGNQALPASCANDNLSVYAARRGDGATTIAVVNKNLGGRCELTLNVAGLKGRMQVWRFDQASGRVAGAPDETADVDGVIHITVPAASASMLVVK
jgi:hypothetical protein